MENKPDQNPTNNAPVPPPVQYYYQVRICDDAWKDEANHEDDNIDHFSVTLREGCFSGYIHIPKTWKTWWNQPAGNDQSAYWRAYWFLGDNPQGPYPGGGDINLGTHPNPMQFRMEGRGTYLFYTNFKVTPQDNSGTETHGLPSQIIPINPTSGASPSYTFSILQCHRSGEAILCSGQATNKTDAQTNISVPRGGTSVDDEGNSAQFDITFPGSNLLSGLGARLFPNVPTNFAITIYDNHQNAKSVNLQLPTIWGDVDGRRDTLFYKEVPVQ